MSIQLREWLQVAQMTGAIATTIGVLIASPQRSTPTALKSPTVVVGTGQPIRLSTAPTPDLF